MGAFVDLTGKRYGRLTVLERTDSTGRNIRWLCRCDCGKESKVFGFSLKRGQTKSCGCLQKEVTSEIMTKHGLTNTPEYKIWKSMRDRINNPNNKAYGYYGGKGITYDPRWESFENFLEDMGERPKGMTLDRIDPNGNYCKENCRWADYSTQGYNQNIRQTNISGRTGVHYHKRDKCWTASIGKEGKLIHLGYFSSFEEACTARESAEKDYFGWTKE